VIRRLLRKLGANHGETQTNSVGKRFGMEKKLNEKESHMKETRSPKREGLKVRERVEGRVLVPMTGEKRKKNHRRAGTNDRKDRVIGKI